MHRLNSNGFKIVFAVFAVVVVFVVAIERSALAERSGQGDVGLERVDCWFDKRPWDIFTRCYYMHVPEDHQNLDGRLIKFPVVHFKRKNVFANKTPVVHLGGGGPGGPMYLNDAYSVKHIKYEHDEFSLKSGRDLIIIDPRGSGLAVPSLTCGQFVKNQPRILKQDLSFVEEWSYHEAAFAACINEFKNEGYNLANYNSLAVANDIDLLKHSLKVEKLVLFGVSYGAVYAQVIARLNPENIESMVLDSAAFPHVLFDDEYRQRTLAPYKAIYNYCSLIESCSVSMKNIKERIWAIYQKLEQNPMRMSIDDYNTGEALDALLNGERFMGALLNASYGMDIFNDLPVIVEELEQGKTDAINPYFEDYVAFLLDPQWGDISAQAHYCYETKPFLNFDKIRESIDLLPKGYIHDSALFSFEVNDFCKEMNVPAIDRSFGEEKRITVPTLFLQGEHDTVTPLSDVKKEKSLFTKSRLLIYSTAHSVITSEECAEISAGKFVEQPFALDLSC